VPETVELQEARISCPYCGEPLTILLDASESGMSYVEDCQVCCQPMIVSVSEDADGTLFASVHREDE
jgi:hypothetical protein